MKKKLNALSETEEEEDVEELGEALEEDAPLPAEPVERAVLQLTRIVDKLAKQKKTRDLDAMLDGIDGGGDAGEGSAGSGSKSKAAIFKKLKGCLRDNPKYLSQTVEELMAEDFHQIQGAPGSQNREVSTRAWLEHRSKIMYYPTTIRFVWMLGGIHDSMRRGAWEEARARTCLALAAADPAAVDSGSWLLAQEMLLEDPAPMSSFQGRKQPESWEQASSRLLDERWLEVFHYKVKSKDAYLESKKRLSKGGGKGETSRPADAQGAGGGKNSKKGQTGKGKTQKGEAKKDGPPEGEGHN